MLEFEERSFCFTGGLADLKRTVAQREVRARGGLTLDRVNDHLDYLVVGSKPASGWKHGSFGRKIESARQLRETHGRPLIVGESEFMESLAAVPPTNSGAIDSRVVVATYKFLLPVSDEVDRDALHGHHHALVEAGAHVALKRYWLAAYQLFNDGTPVTEREDQEVVEVRVVKQFELEEPIGPWLDRIAFGYEAIPGVDGELRHFDRAEGSADYVRLLREVPPAIRLEAR